MRGILTWGPAAMWAAVLFLLSGASDTPDASWLPFGDKLAHVGLYAVLGATLARVHKRLGGPSHVILLLVGLLYGVSDEWHQSFVSGRESSAADVLADAVGIALGYAVGLHVRFARPRPSPLSAPPSS